METLPRLRYDQALLASLPEDTEDAPWMVNPEYQWLTVELLMNILREYVRRQGLRWRFFTEVMVSMPWPNRRGVFVAVPDLFVVEADSEERDSWNIEREGKPPQLVLEVVTSESRHRDIHEKAVIYDHMRVHEYVIFLPHRVAGGAWLQGYRRDLQGQFVAWDAGSNGEFESEVLGGLRLYIHEGTRLRLRDRHGQMLPTEAEEGARQQQRANVEAARADQEAARADQEASLRAEAERLTAKEASLRAEAERELARLRAQLNGPAIREP